MKPFPVQSEPMTIDLDAVANDAVSADKVLVTTRCIFLLPHDIGLIGTFMILHNIGMSTHYNVSSV